MEQLTGLAWVKGYEGEPVTMCTSGTGAPGQSKMPVPIAIEQPDPAAVSWT
jgi:hypothetical protein